MWRLAKLELGYFPRVLQRGFIIYLPLLGIPVFSLYSFMLDDLTEELNKYNFLFQSAYNLPLILRVVVMLFPYIYGMFIAHYMIITLRRSPHRNHVLLPVSIRQSGLTNLVFIFMTYVIFTAVYLIFFALFRSSLGILPIQVQHVVDNLSFYSLIAYDAVVLSIVYALISLEERYSRILSYLYFGFFLLSMFLGDEMVGGKMFSDIYTSIINDFIATVPGALLISFIFCSVFYFSYTKWKSYI